MNHREPPTAPRSAGRAFACLPSLLLLLLAPDRAWSRLVLPPEIASPRPASPYLVTIGAPPLRFQDPAPPAEPFVRPPLRPAVAAEPTATPASTQPSPAASAAATAAQPSRAVAEATPARDAEMDTPRHTPPPILPDEIRPQAKAEDFLPFFQIPVQPGDASVVVPVPRAPAPLPLSSATYTQTPR